MRLVRFLFSYNGRMSRKSFAVYEIAVTLVLIGISTMLTVGMSGIDPFAVLDEEGELGFILALGIFGFFLMIIWTTCVAWVSRRLHDIGRTGKWAIPFLIIGFWSSGVTPENMWEHPFQCFLWLVDMGFFIYLCFKKGEEGVNKYGMPPQ